MKQHIAAALATLAVVPGVAQEQLSKEITIEREIVPEVRAASRLDLYPRQLNFAPLTKGLEISDVSVRTAITPGIATLEPAATEPAAEPTPYRGYLDAGYFPAANASVSAGYAIVSNESARLNVWTQINNAAYKAAPAQGLDKGKFSHLKGLVGVDFAKRFSAGNELGISTAVGYSSFLQPWSVIEKCIDSEKETESQGIFQWDLSAMWQGKCANDLNYHIGAGFNLFNFSEGLPVDEETAMPAVHQTGINFDLGVEQHINSASSAGVDFSGDFLSYNHFMELTDEGVSDSGKTVGVMGLTPFYRWANDVVSLKAGARVNLTVNSGKALHVAPDVLLAVNPASGFGAWLRFGGGEHVNSLQSLEAFSPYIAQTMAYGVSHMPVTGDLGLRFGPLHGVSFTLNVAYASANGWLLPYQNDGQLLFAATDLRAWKAGARINWDFKKLLSFEASFESALGNDEKNTWIEWRDRARHRLSASLTLRPIERLTVDLAYEMRMKRSMPTSMWTTAIDATDAPLAYTDFKLKDVSNLSVGASYAVTDAFTVFARGENLLNTSCYLLPYVPAQGITGLVGIAWKF